MKYYQITDAAKKLNVETHVLRYWEEELDLPIERNKQGHRLYTEEDLDRFSYIMNMKKEGLKLRAIRMKVHGSSAERMPADDLKPEHTVPGDDAAQQSVEREVLTAQNAKAQQLNTASQEKKPVQIAAPRVKQEKQIILQQDTREEKAVQLCMMLQQMVGQAVRQENETMVKNMKKEVADVVAKEMNYQFRMQEDREEEHFRQLDELLRSKCVKQGRFHRKKVK